MVCVAFIRWSTVAVQVGGIQASRGFLGVWSGIDHAFEDPAGTVKFRLQLNPRIDSVSFFFTCLRSNVDIQTE